MDLQLNFNDSNIFGTMEICSRHGLFKQLRLNHGIRSNQANGDNLGMSFRFSIKYM